MQGWVTLCGWQAGIASVAFLIATMIQGLAVYNYPTYVPQRWHATLMMILLGGMATFSTTILKKLLPLWQTLGGVLHVQVIVRSVKSPIMLTVPSPQAILFYRHDFNPGD
jgi:choline transport protein